MCANRVQTPFWIPCINFHSIHKSKWNQRMKQRPHQPLCKTQEIPWQCPVARSHRSITWLDTDTQIGTYCKSNSLQGLRVWEYTKTQPCVNNVKQHFRDEKKDTCTCTPSSFLRLTAGHGPANASKLPRLTKWSSWYDHHRQNNCQGRQVELRAFCAAMRETQ